MFTTHRTWKTLFMYKGYIYNPEGLITTRFKKFKPQKIRHWGNFE